MKGADRKFLIDSNATIYQALVQLNSLHSLAMTLFVTDRLGRMIGTLTDGDIRRAIINGSGLSTPVAEAMHTDFAYITSRDDISTLRVLRERDIILIPLLDERGLVKEVIDLSSHRSFLPVDAVLMAGGKGERLRPLTLETPKPLLKIGERAIIDRNIERLIDYGVTDISVTVNYLKQQLIQHYSQPIKDEVRVNCVEEDRFLGTIGALTLVREFHNDTILVMNSDLLTDIDYEDFYLHFLEHGAMMSAAAIPYTISVPYGIFDLDGRNIKGVTEKPTYNLYANAGIYLLRKEALKYIPKGKVFNATDLIDTLAADSQTVIRYPLTSLWIDIGTPEEYKKANDLIKHLK